ncbi:endoglucanase 23-like precursor [Hordeum vulgare]|nr:endoglucanase 23-like precursor [Hordeum vulgare]
MVFRDGDREYAELLLESAKKAFDFVDTHKDAYSDDIDPRAGGCPLYCDFNGYQHPNNDNKRRFLPLHLQGSLNF